MKKEDPVRSGETARKRIEAQGFSGLRDEEIVELNYWLRLSPAICLAWVAVGLALASPTVLGALVPFALLGAIQKGHPFDAIYNHGIRYLTGTRALPEYCPPRRFACLMASMMISGAAAFFAVGLDLAAYSLGAVMISMASINVTTGFCVPSKLFGLIFGPVSCGAASEPLG